MLLTKTRSRERREISQRPVTRLSSTDGERVLLFAVTANNPGDARRLLAAGAPRVGDNGSLLHVAAVFGGAELLQTLTAAGLRLEDHGGASASPLLSAVQSNRAENVEWLLQNGADANAVDSSGGPVLRHALVCSNAAVIRSLIAAGARIDAKTRALATSKGIDLQSQ